MFSPFGFPMAIAHPAPSSNSLIPNSPACATAARGQAELIAASFATRIDLTYATDNEMEKGYVQYVSGWMFPTFEMQPTLGRLFTANDDRTPGASPYAVISYNYWTHRFGSDPNVLGRSVHIGGKIFQIIGVGPKSFTGTEPGIDHRYFSARHDEPAGHPRR